MAEEKQREYGPFIHNAELVAFGCRNCVWKQYYQCPHGIVKADEFHEFTEKGKKFSGYCIEYISFIQSMSDPGDSSSAMWEKFHLYMAELQSMEDFTELKKLEREITLLMTDGDSDAIKSAESKKEVLKLWWVRLNESVRLGRQKICDREQKARAAAGVALPGIKRTGIDFSKPKQLEAKDEQIK